jgi:DNA-binding IclR family transcriptional regulator
VTTAPAHAAPAGPQSGLQRALQIVYAVAESPPAGIGVSALARELVLPKAVVHRIVKVLATDGFLAFDEQTKRYRLGPRALTVGLAALFQLDVPVVARPYLDRLVGQTGETATLSVRQGWSRVYVDQVLSPQEVRMSVTLGRPYPLHAGSSSKAILSALPDQEIDEYLRHHDLEPITGATLTTPEALREQIARIRELGYAVSAGERQAGAGSVAAPVLRADGSVFGSISLCGPASRFDESMQRRYGWMVAATAAEISVAIGHRQRA